MTEAPLLVSTAYLRAISGASTRQVVYWRGRYLQPVVQAGAGRRGRYGWPWREVVVCRDMVTLVRAGLSPWDAHRAAREALEGRS